MARPSLTCTLLLSGWLTLGCLAPPELSEGSFATTSGDTLQAVSLVPRLVLDDPQGLFPTELWLMEGKLSSASASRLRRGEAPSVVAESRRPLTTWRRPSRLIMQPGAALRPGQHYTVVAPNVGAVAQFKTTDEVRPLLFLWSESRVTPGAWVLYCPFERGDTVWGDPWTVAPETSGAPLSAVARAGNWGAGDDRRAEVELGLAPFEPAAGECTRLRIPSDAEYGVLVPPTSVGEYLVEPTALQVLPETEPEEPLQPLEARLDGTTLELQLPPGVVGLALDSPSPGAGLEALLVQAEPRVWRSSALEANTDVALVWQWLTPGGRIESGSLALRTGAPSARLVITEVLANPLGPEPQGEWVEILNVGSGVGNLRGWALRDSAESTILPHVELAPGEHAIVVRQDYRPDPSVEPIPAAESVPVRVPELGRAGLRNAGETVELVAPDGTVVSRVPALSAPEGVSIARRHPLSLDEADSFARHGPPGSSPGSVNSFEPP